MARCSRMVAPRQSLRILLGSAYLLQRPLHRPDVVHDSALQGNRGEQGVEIAVCLEQVLRIDTQSLVPHVDAAEAHLRRRVRHEDPAVRARLDFDKAAFTKNAERFVDHRRAHAESGDEFGAQPEPCPRGQAVLQDLGFDRTGNLLRA